MTGGAALGLALLGHLHTGTVGKIPHRVRKAQSFCLHHERDDAAACAAAEAVENLLIGRDRERAGLFVMERTQAEVVRAALFQLHILRYDVHDVIAHGQLV